MKSRKRAESTVDAALRGTIASNVRELRRIRHLTQAELARRIGIRSGPLNAIEQGRHVPSGRVLYQLAEHLQVSVDSILGREPVGKEDRGMVESEGGCGVGVVREGQGAGAYVTHADTGEWPRAVPVVLPEDPCLDNIASARIDAVCRAFLALEDLCGAQKRAQIPLYLPFRKDEEGLEELTARVRQILGVNQAVIFDYLELLENAGLRVVFCPLSESVQSAAYYDPANCNVFLIVSDRMNVERQLFELVKRLGSIYVYTMGALCPVAGRGEGGVLDPLRAARKFAALFLMPAQSVRASVAQLGIGPGEWTYPLVLRIKHRFGVSAQAFVFRLKELRLIEEGVADRIAEKIEAHYVRTNYGEPDSTRRILSPNGRLGDLLLAALEKPGSREEAGRIRDLLRANGVDWAGGSAPAPKRGRVRRGG